ARVFRSRSTTEKGTHVEGASVVKHVRLFAALESAELDVVSGAARRKQYPKGSIVFHEGDPGDCLLVIVKGRLKVSLLGREGDETIIRVLEPPDYVGEIALVDDAPRSATVIALERTEVLEI